MNISVRRRNEAFEGSREGPGRETRGVIMELVGRFGKIGITWELDGNSASRAHPKWSKQGPHLLSRTFHGVLGKQSSRPGVSKEPISEIFVAYPLASYCHTFSFIDPSAPPPSPHRAAGIT